jgi:hypothetical protein
MDSIKLFLAEYVFGYAFQSCVYVLALFAFNRKKVIFIKYIFSAIGFGIAAFITRSLPISFGVHTLLSLIVLAIIGVLYLKMPVYPTIRATLFAVIILLIGESLNVAGLTILLGKEEFSRIMNIPMQKALAGIPSSIIFAGITIIFYFILTKNKKD